MRAGAFIVASAIICAAGLAWAQDRPVPDNPTHVDPKGCAPHERLTQGELKSGAKTPQNTTGENLSDKLARTDGVLCPPNVDPDIRQPAPGGGKTPVIPPPGSPGGDQSVQPK